jgi:hypothetical protein
MGRALFDPIDGLVEDREEGGTGFVGHRKFPFQQRDVLIQAGLFEKFDEIYRL